MGFGKCVLSAQSLELNSNGISTTLLFANTIDKWDLMHIDMRQNMLPGRCVYLNAKKVM